MDKKSKEIYFLYYLTLIVNIINTNSRFKKYTVVSWKWIKNKVSKEEREREKIDVVLNEEGGGVEKIESLKRENEKPETIKTI